jgi:hypothetical protein
MVKRLPASKPVMALAGAVTASYIRLVDAASPTPMSSKRDGSPSKAHSRKSPHALMLLQEHAIL